MPEPARRQPRRALFALVPRELHTRLRVAAAREGVSLRALVERAVRRELGEPTHEAREERDRAA
jgi:predicted HicB family RNase H-like nuclease